MHRLILAVAALGLTMLVVVGPASAGLTEAAELHHARMNALAGGPVSARDAELLGRWGCYSGTTGSGFCQAQSHRRYKRPHRRYKRRRRR